MFNATIIGNLTKDPTLRTVNTSKGPASVVTLDVAINGRKVGDKQPVTYIRATAWNGLAETLAKYLQKGRKVCFTTDFIEMRTNEGKDGKSYTNLECTISNFEFIDRGGEAKAAAPAPAQAPATDPQSGFETVDTADLPF